MNERKLVSGSMLRPYASMTKEAMTIGSDVCQKLVRNLLDKESYVVGIRNLKYYCEKGLILGEVHSVIRDRFQRFKQSCWMKSCIDYLAFALLKTQATSSRAKICTCNPRY